MYLTTRLSVPSEIFEYPERFLYIYFKILELAFLCSLKPQERKFVLKNPHKT